MDSATTPVVDGGKLQIQPVSQAARSDDETKINWIFEYAKGETVAFGSEVVTTPRANRVILATRPKGSIMSFDETIAQHLPALGESIDVAFMAGYHYAEPVCSDGRSFEEFMGDSVKQLHALKQENLICDALWCARSGQTELRCSRQSVRKSRVWYHENDQRVIRNMAEAEMEAIDKDERAYSLYKGALKLLDTCS